MKRATFILITLFICVTLAGTSFSGEYRKHSNAAISGHNVEHLTGVSVHDCMRACSSRSWCKSFDYFKNQAKCDLSDKHQQEVGGLKTNYSGNPYDHYHRKTYKVFRNAAISGHNVEHLTGVSPSDCMRACNDRGWCKSFDYFKNQAKCDLSDKSRLEVGLKTNYSGNPYDHYAKQ
ncbi:MAG: PAN domain-containing protein [Desulfovibrionaceae bacterium]